MKVHFVRDDRVACNGHLAAERLPAVSDAGLLGGFPWWQICRRCEAQLTPAEHQGMRSVQERNGTGQRLRLVSSPEQKE